MADTTTTPKPADPNASLDSYRAAGYGVLALTSLAEGYAQSQAIRAQSSFQQTMAAINNRLALKQAESVIKRGNEQAAAVRRRGEQVAGAQRAAAAAQGIEADSGSAAEIRIDTEQAVTNDILAAQNNAWQEAWGIRTQTALAGVGSSMQASGANFAANQTLLTGGLKALSATTDGVLAYNGYDSKQKKTTKAPAAGDTTLLSDSVNSGDAFYGTVSREDNAKNMFTSNDVKPRWWQSGNR